MGVAVSKLAMLTHCQALTQACNYIEGEFLAVAVTSALGGGLGMLLLTVTPHQMGLTADWTFRERCTVNRVLLKLAFFSPPLFPIVIVTRSDV